MQLILPIIAVLLVGVGIAVETPTNAMLTKASGSVLWGSLISFAVGTATLAAAILVTRARMQPGWAAQTPWYAFLGGLYGAAVVGASAWATPRLGAGVTLVLIVAAQVALGVGMDHLGLLGLERRPATWVRMAGVAVVAAGALMITFD